MRISDWSSDVCSSDLDVATPEDAVACLEESGADGVMIGRGAYGRPWILRQVADRLAGRPVAEPPPAVELKALVTEHPDAMLTHYGTQSGIRNARKHIGWYSQSLPDSLGSRQGTNNSHAPARGLEAIDRCFARCAC